MYLRYLAIPLGAAILAGCASREHPVPLNTYQSVAMAEPISPVTPPADYRINPSDELRIDVFGEPQLSLTDLPVSPNGNIVMPLVGEMRAEGQTPMEFSGQIAAALRRYLREPQVAVNVTKFTSQKVTVTGAVRVAGVFETVPQMTLLDAIALGQGLGDYSKRDEVIVFRRQDGKRYIARFDLDMIQNGELGDPTIMPGDVVVVGYSEGRRLFSDAIALLPAAVGVFIALIN
jgi:polysaccharide biosynthesis/export protein